MKRYFSLCFVLFMSGLLVGCKSEQQKAFELVKDSNDLNALRSFAATYGDSMEDKVRVLYDTTYTRLLKDSTLFASIENAQSILDRYIAEKNYIAILPNGIHIDEVNVLLSEDKSKADEISQKLDSFRKAFKQYKFVETVLLGWDAGISDYEELDDYEFEGPDMSGKGNLIITSKPIKSKYNYEFSDGMYHIFTLTGRVDRECVGTYYVNDDLKIVAIIDEKRSYENDGDFSEYESYYRNDMHYGEQTINRCKTEYNSKAVPALIKRIKSQFPQPKTRTMILVLDNDPNSIPSLSGIDSNRADCFFNTVLK